MKGRAAALLLLAVACNRTPAANWEEIYRQARLAINQGDLKRAKHLGAEGLKAPNCDASCRDLFTVVSAEVLVRTDPPASVALLDHTPASGNAEAQVRRLIVRAYAQKELGKLPEAAAEYDKASLAAAAMMPSLRGEIAVLRVGPTFGLRQYAAAKQLALQAITISTASRDHYALANAYGMLGTVEMNQQQWADALEHFATAERLARQVGAESTLSFVSGNVGWCSQ